MLKEKLIIIIIIKEKEEKGGGKMNNCKNCPLKKPILSGWRCKVLQMAVFPEVPNMGKYCDYHPARKGKGNKIVNNIMVNYYHKGGKRRKPK